MMTSRQNERKRSSHKSNGSVRPYRGTAALIKSGTGGRTVNNVLLEEYVKAVVPAEMPTSWAANAVRAQAVAARSYAVRLRTFSRYSGYHICATTACQIYAGRVARPPAATRQSTPQQGSSSRIEGW
jgi:stage II sporulation protein D